MTTDKPHHMKPGTATPKRVQRKRSAEVSPKPEVVKYVTIGIEMDSTFIRLLNACVALSQLRERDEMTPMQQLALLVLTEARGGLEGEVHASILNTWRPHISAVSELRSVKTQGARS